MYYKISPYNSCTIFQVKALNDEQIKFYEEQHNHFFKKISIFKFSEKVKSYGFGTVSE